MKHRVIFGFLLLAALSCAAQNMPSTPSSKLYDDFTYPFLQPSKWSAIGACHSDNGVELECVREIQNGKLRLAHKNYGNRDTDVGFVFGSDSVVFTHPSRIKSITTDVTIARVVESPCPSNPSFGAAAHIDATFFNTGSGDLNDDVGGHLALGHSVFDDSGKVTVFGQISQGNNYFFFLNLGTVKIGTPVTASLRWDQANHQFLVSWTNLVTNVKTEGTMPYTFEDTTPPTDPTKVLTVNSFPANCTAKSSWVYMEATFDNVFIN